MKKKPLQIYLRKKYATRFKELAEQEELSQSELGAKIIEEKMNELNKLL